MQRVSSTSKSFILHVTCEEWICWLVDKTHMGAQVSAETEAYVSLLPMGWALKGPMVNVIARFQQRSAVGFLEVSLHLCRAFAAERGLHEPLAVISRFCLPHCFASPIVLPTVILVKYSTGMTPHGHGELCQYCTVLKLYCTVLKKYDISDAGMVAQ